MTIPVTKSASSDAGGVFVTKVNEVSSNTVISAGIIVPAWFAVRALYSLTTGNGNICIAASLILN